jgi:hypothetical protein
MEMEETEDLEPEMDPTMDPMEMDPPLPPPPRRGRKMKVQTPPARETREIQRELTAQLVSDLRSWIDTLGGHQDFQFVVRRLSPKIWQDIPIEGTLDTFDIPIDEETIRDHYGGGTYQIIVRQRNGQGKLEFLTSRVIKISGEPKIAAHRNGTPGGSGGKTNGNGTSGEFDVLALRAMDNMQWQLRQAREDASAKKEGFDPRMMELLQAPLIAQLSELQRQMSAKDAQILQLITQKPDAPPPGGTFQDRILTNMIENESARITAVRAQHESETRQLKEGFRQELAFVREAAKEELRIREKQHERELEAIRDATKVASGALENASAMRIDGLKSEINRLERELSAAKVEMAELRSRKDKSLTEQAQEIVKVQDAFKALGVGGKDDEEDEDANKPFVERMFNRALENPEAIGQMLGGVRGAIAPPGAAPAAAPQLPPPGQPFQTPSGEVFMMRPDGKAQRLNPAALKKKVAAAKAAMAAAQGPRPPEPAEVAMAISFMESAISNGTTPESFAQTAQTMIPADVRAHLEKTGIDEFLNAVSLDSNSSLRSQVGRNWARSVARILLEGV